MQTTATLPLAWIHGVKHRLSMHGHVEHVGLYLLRRLEPELGQAAPPSLPPSLSLPAVRSTTSASASARICTSTTRGAAAAVSWGALQASTLPTTELHRQGENAATATLRTLPLRLRAPSPASSSAVEGAPPEPTPLPPPQTGPTGLGACRAGRRVLGQAGPGDAPGDALQKEWQAGSVPKSSGTAPARAQRSSP